MLFQKNDLFAMENSAVTMGLIGDNVKPPETLNPPGHPAGFGYLLAGAALLDPAIEMHTGWTCGSPAESSRPNHITRYQCRNYPHGVSRSTYSKALGWALEERQNSG